MLGLPREPAGFTDVCVWSGHDFVTAGSEAVGKSASHAVRQLPPSAKDHRRGVRD